MKPQLSHVGIYISDTEKMIAFYEEVSGLTVTDRGSCSSSKLPISLRCEISRTWVCPDFACVFSSTYSSG